MKIVALVSKTLGIGFRLSGIETFSPEGDMAVPLLEKINKDPNIGLVIVSKSYESKRKNLSKPCIVIEEPQNA